MEVLHAEGNDPLDAVLRYIDEQKQPFITRLMDYASHPSISAQGVGIDEVATLLRDAFLAIGLEAEILPTDGNPVVLAKWNGKPGGPTVLLYGHYDVQPPDPLDAWLTPPFAPTIRDERIFARGIGDNKGQHFAQILAVESHLKVHGTLPCNVIFMLDGEEEVGSPNLLPFALKHRERLKADLVITADGSLHPSGTPVVQFGVRGLLTFELHARGAKHDVHSGNFGGIVVNPVWTLVHLLSTMKSPAGEITIDGLLNHVDPPTAQERAAIERLPIDIEGVLAGLGLTRLDQPLARGYFERLMFHPTLTINGFHGGYGGRGMKTIIPGSAFVKCDMRLVESQTPDEVFDLIVAHVARHAPEVEVVRLNSMTPSKTPITSAYTKNIVNAIERAQGTKPFLYPLVGGSLPDYVFTKALRLPAFLIPYANADQANHAPNENMRIDCFINGIRTGAALLSYLFEGEAKTLSA
ncbi:M20/M25/M40 family metallo-hydrolase [Paraburkholderia unamae]|uniref:Acetylornithine deacetylase/succinyl-diaminopimelate desuccinylase-like protein n=1 Tax=Paraburkholderia unamae TaxID=219649 RepID=A0ABX5KDG0_9BURK|nr:M20/M25/M40 family metallo-hydrolase [Paraburkholderia unamae]PVX75149.1 acetylornithine deacetylase/succinyl-diaminopimelate desuccinylase-like protein [Paraburkholderia unamae]